MEDAPLALIVSPDPTLVAAIRQCLEPRGFLVQSAPSGDAALMRSRHRPPALVLVQHELPGQSGAELAQQIAAQVIGVATVLICQEQGLPTVPMSYSGYVLARPFEPAELFAVLSRFASETAGSMPGPFSIVDAASGLFGATGGASEVAIAVEDADLSLASGAVQAIGTGEYSAVQAHATQELPALNLEVFDEHRPVAVPVGATTTAHGLRAVAPPEPDPEQKKTNAHPAARPTGPAPLGPRTGEMPALAVGEAGVQRLVNEGIERAMKEGGSIRVAMEAVVQDAITRALADAMPVIAQETARQIARNLKI